MYFLVNATAMTVQKLQHFFLNVKTKVCLDLGKNAKFKQKFDFSVEYFFLLSFFDLFLLDYIFVLLACIANAIKKNCYQ